MATKKKANKDSAETKAALATIDSADEENGSLEHDDGTDRKFKLSFTSK